GVATHYPELRLARPGAHLVRVCTGVSCRINGGTDLLAALARRLGVTPGATMADGAVTLEEADCCFARSLAPGGEVDHGYLSAPSIDEIVAACRARPPQPAHPAQPVRVPRAGATVRLLVGAGSCGLARGAAATLEALQHAFPDADVRAGACPGLC